MKDECGIKYKESFISKNYAIEVDVLVKEYAGVKLEKPLAIEVNGVHHYPRNSEDPIGKDLLKEKVLVENEGFCVLTIPYFAWYILENDQRAPYLKSCIENAIA